MTVSKDYLDYVQEQLAVLGPVVARKMFGGVGFYRDGLFFALADDDELYFKVDETTRPHYEAAGMAPFQPFGEAQPMRGYYQVPPEALEDADELKSWALAAVAVAGRAALKKSPRKR